VSDVNIKLETSRDNLRQTLPDPMSLL